MRLFPTPSLSLFAAAAFSLVTASTASAQIVNYRVCLDGNQEVPVVVTNGIGMATVSLDTSTGAVNVNGTYTNLNGNQTVAHIHGPAPVGGNGGVVVTLAGTGGMAGMLSGSGALTAPEVLDMLNGQTYLNIHSTSTPSGEIRGQIVQKLSTFCPAQLATDPFLADISGDPSFGPKINHPTEAFNVMLNCSGAPSAGTFAIVIKLIKLAAPSPSPVGDIWFANPKLIKMGGVHVQNAVTFAPADVVLPNDVSLVGIEYTIQGFCGDNVNPGGGRVSNAIVEVIGI